MIPKSGHRFSGRIMPKYKNDGSDPKLDQTLWPKPFKDHLICKARGALALLWRTYGPGQKRQAENVASDPGRRRGQVVHPVGNKMRPGAECVSKMQHAAA